ncbi:unnamed protein product [Mytilus edulis]|uniref:Uncharacterized protein n=1 Tax=Mytilus edulis TaxID=6550 RepID=A0A8S3RT49_MYTED|nr:unnamed protein product [Mytilus edulis]
MNRDKTKDQSDPANEKVTETTLPSIGSNSRPSSGSEASRIATAIESKDEVPGDSSSAGSCHLTNSPTDTKPSDLNNELEDKETKRQSSSDKITTSRPPSGSRNASRPTSASKTTKEINDKVDDKVCTGTQTPPDRQSRPSSGIDKTSKPTSANKTTKQIDDDFMTSEAEGPIVVNNENVSRPTSKSKESPRPSSTNDKTADVLPADELDISKASETMNKMSKDKTKDQSDPANKNVIETTLPSIGSHSRPSSGTEASRVATAIETEDKIPGDSSSAGKLSPVNNVSSPTAEANKISRTNCPTDTKPSDLNNELEDKETKRQSSSDKITTTRPPSGSRNASRPTIASKTTKEINGQADDEVFTGTQTPPDRQSRLSSGIDKTSRPTSANKTTKQIDDDIMTSEAEGPIVVNNENVSRPTSKSEESPRPSSTNDKTADLLPADKTDISKSSETMNKMNKDKTKDQSDPAYENVTETTLPSIGSNSRPSSGSEASRTATVIETKDEILGDSSSAGSCHLTNSPTDTKPSDLNNELEDKETKRQSSLDYTTTSRPPSGSRNASRQTSASNTTKEINGQADDEVFSGTQTPPGRKSRPSSGKDKTSRPTSANKTTKQIDDDIMTSEAEGPIVVNNENVSRPTSKSEESPRPSSTNDKTADVLPADETDISKASETMNKMNKDKTKDQSDPANENVTETTLPSIGSNSRPSSGSEASRIATAIETKDEILEDSSSAGQLSSVNNVSSPTAEVNTISRTNSPTDTKPSDLNNELEDKETKRQSSSDYTTTTRPPSGSRNASRPTSASKTTKEINGQADDEVFTGTQTPPERQSRPSSGIDKTSKPTSANKTTKQIDDDIMTSEAEGPIVVNNENVSRPTSKSEDSPRPSSTNDKTADLLPADETATSKASETMNKMNEDKTKDQSDPANEKVTLPSIGSHSRPSSGTKASRIATAIETKDEIPGYSSSAGSCHLSIMYQVKQLKPLQYQGQIVQPTRNPVT